MIYGDAVTIDSPVYQAELSIPLSWTDSGSGYHTAACTVDMNITSSSKIDLQPNTATLAAMRSAGTKTLYVENTNGTLTAYAWGRAPTAALTVPCTVVTTEGGGSTVVGEALSIDAGCSDTLWTNGSPTSSFAAQDVTLSADVRGYDYLYIDLIFSGSNPDRSVQVIPVEDFCVASRNYSLRINAGSYNRTGARNIWMKYSGQNITDYTKIHFDSASYNTSTANGYAIPQKITGVRL